MDFFQRIDAQFRKSLPFVAFRKPGEITVKALFQSDDQLHHLKNYSETGFIFAPFDKETETILLVPDEILDFSGVIAEETKTKTKTDVIVPTPDLPKTSKTEDTPDLANTANNIDLSNTMEADRPEYLKLLGNAITAIERGDFKKVVLSRRLEIGSNVSPLEMFRKLLKRYSAAFCYLWYHPKVGIWLGATPEILLNLRNRQLTTMSLAGTQKYTGQENPPWGRKELEEQELVTEYIIKALENEVSDLKRFPQETLRAGDLLHLRTKISGTIKGDNLASILKALHPTPAVGGLPKENALKFISENENYDREFYTGFLGELNLKAQKQRNSRKGNQENQAYRSIVRATTLYVNLRCMQLKDDKALIYVGGGITKDSDPAGEWAETVAKSSTMLRVLG